MKKVISGVLAVLLLVFSIQGPAFSVGEESLTRGAASLLIPGLGQYINGEFATTSGKVKTGTMILLEAGAIITTSVVGGVAGYPQIWAGIGIFIFNHIWSSADAYMRAPAGPEVSLKEKTISDR